jgi:transcriptional antiterminator NusG
MTANTHAEHTAAPDHPPTPDAVAADTRAPHPEMDGGPPHESAAETIHDTPVAEAAPVAPEPEVAAVRAEETPPPAAEPEPTAVDVAEPPAAEQAAAEGAPGQAAPPDNKHWYIVKVQSGREESIKEAVERRVKIEGLEEYFGQIKIPVEKVSEMRNGKRVVRSRKKFPGYLMVNVEFNDRILYLFRETSGVGDFVGATINRAPTPMPQHEVDRMLAEEAATEGKPGVRAAPVKLKFDKGDRVRVRDGTFQGMEGEVKEIVEPKEPKDPVRVRVELTIFGRPVPVEVEAWQVDPV